MAAPDFISSTSNPAIHGLERSAVNTSIGSTATALLTCATNHALKTLSISVTNIDPSTTYALTLQVNKGGLGGTSRSRLLAAVSIPPGQPFVYAAPVCLEEADILEAFGSTASKFEAVVTYKDTASA